MISVQKIAEARGLDEEDVIEFLRDFVEYTRNEDFRELEAALADRNLTLAKKRAHSIKGAALNLQLMEIAAAAEKMEKQVEVLSVEEIRDLLVTLSRGLDEVTEFLDKLE